MPRMPVRAWLLVASLFPLLALFCGCSASRPAQRQDTDGALAEIEKLVLGQYAAIERGDLAAWSTAFAKDVLLLGSDPGEVMLGRDSVLSRMNQSAGARMASNVKRTYRSTRLHIGLAPDGRAGWVADLIEYRRQGGSGADGTKAVWFRMSAAVARRDAGWEILAAHYSVAVPDERAFATAWPLPAEIPASPAPSPVAALIPEGPLDHFPGLFSDRPDVLLIGTTQEEWISSGPEVQRFTGQGKPGKIRVERRGGVRTGATDSIAWAAWNGALTIPGQRGLPVRILSVFLRTGEQWLKVQEHVSIPVPD